MTVSRRRRQHGPAAAVRRRLASDSPAIRELHSRGTPRGSRVRGGKTSRTSTIREALRGVPEGTNPRWASTPPDYPAIREPSRRRTPLVPRVRTTPVSCTSTVREASRRPPRAEPGAP
jgi:hypothetical protein